MSTTDLATPLVQTQAQDSGTLALQLMQIVGALGLVIGLIFALAWLARRRGGFTQRGMMNLVERVSLGQKESLYLVRVNGELLLIGVASGSVNLLKTVEAEEPASMPVDPGFAVQLARVLGH